jgi:hypothetical protein
MILGAARQIKPRFVLLTHRLLIFSALFGGARNPYRE